jgi:septum formation protein
MSQLRVLWLASASPRRAELLRAIGVPFQLLSPPDIDERPHAGEAAATYVRRMALEKAQAGWQRLAAGQHDSAAVLGADTTVVLGGHILGKPDDAEHAIAMLGRLSGAEHRVLSAVTVCTADTHYSALSESVVRLAPLSEDEIRRYVATGEPLDKAGSYGIQGFGALLVEQISGSYSGVVGLPLRESGVLLSQAGVPVWQSIQENR